MIIVVADDDPDDHFFIREAFRELNTGASVHSVYNGLELLKWMEDHELPHLVLMDLNMPLLTGIGALTAMKSQERLKSIPVYMLSTSRFEYDKVRAKELGAVDFYTKPEKYHDLKSVIHEIYERSCGSQNQGRSE